MQILQVKSVNRNDQMIEWIVDTGASDHMISGSSMLNCTYKLETPIHIGLPDETIQTVTEAGIMRISKAVELKDILVVPGFKHNLLYVGKLLDDLKLTTLFFSNGYLFQDHGSKEDVLKGERRNGLYKISSTVESRKPEASVFVNSSNAMKFSMDVIHARLGHVYLSKTRHIFSSSQLNDVTPCETCDVAKHHNLIEV